MLKSMHLLAEPLDVGVGSLLLWLFTSGGSTTMMGIKERNFRPLPDDLSLEVIWARRTTSWPRTAILSERYGRSVPNRWDMLRMRDKVYTRYESNEKEYCDLTVDPYQVHNALGASDTTYAPPDAATRAHYEKRLDDLYACAEGSCRTAENDPSLPAGIVP